MRNLVEINNTENDCLTGLLSTVEPLYWDHRRAEGSGPIRGGPKWRLGPEGVTLSIDVIYTYMILVFIVLYGEICSL